MDLYSKEAHGQVIWECSRSTSYMAGTSLFYGLFCAAFLILLLEYPGFLSYTMIFLVVLLTLWRIHLVHKSVVLVCERKLLVTIPLFYSRFDVEGLIKPIYMAFDYKEIVGISDDWNYLFIGERTSGGIVEVPVQLRYTAGTDKIKLQEWVERKQREA